MQTNLRFGCVILRHYLDRESGDLFMALGRYNGSRGRSRVPERGVREPKAVADRGRATGARGLRRLKRRAGPARPAARRRPRRAADSTRSTRVGNHFVDARRAVIEGRQRRKDDAAHLGRPRVMLRRWARLNGVSRTISSSRRRSFSITSAARVSRLSPSPCATAASVRIEHGATTIAVASKLPLARQAPMSPRRIGVVGQRFERASCPGPVRGVRSARLPA